jgi:thiamine biosynthesis lipoprotein ApbE
MAPGSSADGPGMIPGAQATAPTAKVATVSTMGTVVSIRFGTGATNDAQQAARTAVADVFARWDERFSLYRADSELSRIARGELRLTEASPQLRDCYALALDWRDRTDGVFTPHRADGVIDLSGIVKSLAIAEAGAAVTALGPFDWSINAGGDILVSGDQGAAGADQAEDWVAGIVDPLDRQALLARVPLGRPLRAVATSGSAERGEHIWTPFPDAETPGEHLRFVQVSVFAADIVTVDVLATTIVAGGSAALNRATDTFPVQVLAVLPDGSLLATPGLRQA